jgi:ankyrin repeat protein
MEKNRKEEEGGCGTKIENRHWRKLHEPIWTGNINKLKEALEGKLDSNTTCPDGLTPLHEAIRCKIPEIVELLLQYGANTTFPRRNKKEEHIPTSYVSRNGGPLHLACQVKSISIVKLLLNAGVDPNTPDDDLWSPLHTACSAGDPSIVEYLLQNGAKPNATTKLGVTPLHTAAHNGIAKVVEILLKHGANPNIKKKTGQTPLTVAKAMEHEEAANLIQTHIIRQTVLRIARHPNKEKKYTGEKRESGLEL